MKIVLLLLVFITAGCIQTGGFVDETTTTLQETTTTVQETTTTSTITTTTTIPEVTTTTAPTTTTIPTTTTTVPETQAAISEIQFDAPGKDNATNINEEWVRVSGSGDMTSWTLGDESSHVYTFPDGFMLGGTVTIHTGSGEDTATDLYWGRGSHVWNNNGDTAYLKDAGGNIVSEATNR